MNYTYRVYFQSGHKQGLLRILGEFEAAALTCSYGKKMNMKALTFNLINGLQSPQILALQKEGAQMIECLHSPRKNLPISFDF